MLKDFLSILSQKSLMMQIGSVEQQCRQTQKNPSNIELTQNIWWSAVIPFFIYPLKLNKIRSTTRPAWHKTQQG